jgi:hypothetical protein
MTLWALRPRWPRGDFEDAMANSRTLVIGPAAPRDMRQGWLLSDTNLSEFSTIIWAPESLLREMADRGGGRVREEWVVAAYSRIGLVDDWVRQGHSLIVIVPRLHPTEYGFDLTKHEIFSGINFSTASGGSIEYCGPTEAKPLLGLFIGHLHYQSILEGEDLIALMRVHRARAGREQIVSGFRRHGAGSMIFVPPFERPNASEHLRYVATLAELPRVLTASRPILPEWTEYFWTADEAAAQRAISSAEATIAELQAELRPDETRLRSWRP